MKRQYGLVQVLIKGLAEFCNLVFQGSCEEYRTNILSSLLGRLSDINHMYPFLHFLCSLICYFWSWVPKVACSPSISLIPPPTPLLLPKKKPDWQYIRLYISHMKPMDPFPLPEPLAVYSDFMQVKASEVACPQGKCNSPIPMFY